jgi:hypothetical protein
MYSFETPFALQCRGLGLISQKFYRRMLPGQTCGKDRVLGSCDGFGSLFIKTRSLAC